MSSTAPAPFVLGGRLRLAWNRAAAWSAAAVVAVIALPLRGLFLSTGSSMEEGFMLVFPYRLNQGDVPNLDFLHLYGPFSIHVLAGWYRVFGYTLESQRVFGLIQHLGIITALYCIARAWGHLTATITAITVTLLVLTPIGLSALAWEGGVALGLWSLAFGLRAMHTDGTTRRSALAVAGLLAAFALGYRPDLVIALALAHGWLLWRRRGTSSTLAPVALGLAVGFVPSIVHVAMAGVGNSIQGMFLDPVLHLRPGRELPRPPGFGRIDGALQAVAEGPLDAPWWRLPALGAAHQLFLWFFVVIAVAVTLPVVARRLMRSSTTPLASVLFGASLFGLGMLPQALQRPDSTHLAWGSCVSFALLPCLVVEVLRRRNHRDRLRRNAPVVAALAVGAVMFIVCPFFTYRYYLLQSRISVGSKPGGFEVHRDDRRFYFGNAALQHASQDAIDDLQRLSKPGERLLVGPADLSRTIYSDVVFYYLFPELVPATYFIEMDPGLADRPGSRLAADVASADWLVLTNFWTGWYEPNASIQFGSDEPNTVVADHFCLVGNYDDALVMLYQRCERGDGVSPAGIGLGAQRRADLDAEIAKRAKG